MDDQKDITVIIKWQRDYEKHTDEVSCISLDPPILLTHDDDEYMNRKWYLIDGVWQNPKYDEACFPFARALTRAHNHFKKLEHDLESILLGDK